LGHPPSNRRRRMCRDVDVDVGLLLVVAVVVLEVSSAAVDVDLLVAAVARQASPPSGGDVCFEDLGPSTRVVSVARRSRSTFMKQTF
jgi:hypothetical protein